MPADISVNVSAGSFATSPSEFSDIRSGLDSVAKGYRSGIGSNQYQLVRTLLPVNGEADLIGSGENGFRFEGFPNLVDSNGDPMLDYNGIPLEMPAYHALVFRVQYINNVSPAEDAPSFGGSVKLHFVDGGNTFTRVGITSPAMFVAVWSETPITPDELAKIEVNFIPTTGPASAVNAFVEILLIGGDAPPEEEEEGEGEGEE